MLIHIFQPEHWALMLTHCRMTDRMMRLDLTYNFVERSTLIHHTCLQQEHNNYCCRLHLIILCVHMPAKTEGSEAESGKESVQEVCDGSVKQFLTLSTSACSDTIALQCFIFMFSSLTFGDIIYYNCICLYRSDHA